MIKCSYCNKEQDEFMGIHVADSVSGKVKYFCSGKCRLHAERKPKRRSVIPKKKWAMQNLEAVKATKFKRK